MNLSAFHLECRDIAEDDQRWWACPDEASPCRSCGRETAWVAPDGNPTCPWCWDWASDAKATRRPAAPPVAPPAPDLAPMPCANCGAQESPRVSWRVVGKKKKKLVIAASCVQCKRWIRWLPSAYKRYAPPIPPIEIKRSGATLIETKEDAVEPTKSGYIDTSGSSGRKQKEWLPPPPDDKPVEPLELAVALERLWKTGARLHLNEGGEVSCSNPWHEIPAAVADPIIACAGRVKAMMVEDILWQIGAVARGHVIHIVPGDQYRADVVKRWEAAGRPVTEDRPPEPTLDDVEEMEREALDRSPTERAISRRKGIIYLSHADACPIFTQSQENPNNFQSNGPTATGACGSMF